MNIAIATTLVAFCILQTVVALPPHKEAQQLSKPYARPGSAAIDQNHNYGMARELPSKPTTTV